MINPTLLALWMVGLVFYVAGLLTYRYVAGGRTRHDREAPESPAEPHEKTLLEQQLDDIIEYHQQQGW